MTGQEYDATLLPSSAERQFNDNGILLDTETLTAVQATLHRLGRSYGAAESRPAGGSQTKCPASVEGRQAHRAAGVSAVEPGASVQQSRILRAVAGPMELPASIHGLRQWILQKRISPAEALAIQDRHFRKEDTDIHSVARFCEWSVVEDATLPLAGIALAHKDNIASGQFAPGNGLPPQAVTADSPVPPMAPVVERFARTGASQLATLVMAERACGATSENHHYPRVVNPLDASLFVGGSSSGSAAAVAAGFCYGALGTDTAGSVRIPAASCGLLGFKPSRGYFPGEGVLPLAPSLDSVGLLTRSAADMQALCHLHASVSLDNVSSQDWAGLAPKAVANCLPLSGMETSVADALEKFLKRLSGMQVELLEQTLELPRAVSVHGETLFYYEAAQHHGEALRDDASNMNVVARQICAQGLVIPAQWYRQAIQERAFIRDAFIARHFGDADVLLMPAFGIPVPEYQQVTFRSSKFDAAALLGIFRWMMPANYLDLPALVMPVGTDRYGRPVSVQVLGRPGSEAKLLAFAHQFEVVNGDSRGLFGLGAPHMQP